jgi:putative spermidine/putrescine transport system substrate-binding protein
MKRRLTAFFLVVLFVLTAGFFFYVWKSAPTPSLTVATWTGPYGHAQMSAQMTPFSRKSGVFVRFAEYDGGTTDLARQVAGKTYAWDVLDMELPDAVAACQAGLLEKIDAASLPASPAGAAAAQDFIAGALGPCWVGSSLYSRLIAFDAARFAGNVPAHPADFFDLKTFPGPRALPKASAKYILELALMADGVKPADVYAVLTSSAGRARAFAKLDTIKSAFVWADADDPPIRMLREGRAAFALVLNGDIFDAANTGQRPGVIWDGQLYEFDVLAIPKGDPKRALALDYIRFATGAPALGAVASWVPYGPARMSGLAYVGNNPDLKIAMRPFLPSAHGRLAGALAVDETWWRRHQDGVDSLWQDWATKK